MFRHCEPDELLHEIDHLRQLQEDLDDAASKFIINQKLAAAEARLRKFTQPELEAPGISRELIDSIKERVGILGLVEEYGGRPRPAGRNMLALCPFHTESTPSFTIYEDDHAHCFGCGWHGDVITFVMELDRLRFREAVEKLAKDAGIDIPKRATPQQKRAPKPADAEHELDTDYHLSDLGNAQRLRDLHRTDIRYCHPWGRWLFYDGRQWQIDENGMIVRLAKETVREIYAEAAAAEEDQRKALAKWALQSENERRIKAMIELAKSEPGIPVMPDELDADTWLFNTESGTIDLRTGELRKHRREDLITKCPPVTYDPTATCPTFNAFLTTIFEGNRDLMQFVQRAVGYSLTGNTREQVIFIAHGTGRNGKSTFTTTLLSLLGEYGQQTPTETLMVKRGDSIPNDLARLKGTRLVAAMESDEGRRLSEALIKQLSGGDRIPARFMRSEWFEFQPTFKIWLATNHKPVIRGTDLAIWRRIRLVPFTVTISEQEEDKQLGEKLQAEFPGILRWAVEGCLAWQQHGLGMPEAVKNATAGYREEMDVLGAWVAECCVIEPNAKAGAKELYASYTAWCEAGGERALSQRAFGLQLGERGFERYRGTGKKHMWRGIGLKSDPYDPAPDDRDPMGPSRFPNTDAENDQVGTHRDPDSRLNSLYLPRKGLCRNQGPLGPSQDNDEALEEEEWVG